MLKEWVFYRQAIILYLGACGMLFLNGNFKTYVKEDIDDDFFLTMVGVVGSIGNGFSRLVWNVVFRKGGYKTALSANLYLAIAIYSAIRFTVEVEALYMLLIFLINCCLGGILVSGPTFSQTVFGQRVGSNKYGLYWECFALSNFTQYLFVSQLSKAISFNWIIYIVLAMAVLALPFLVIGKFQGSWNNDPYPLEFKPCTKHENPESQ